jgi:hypothetical protein
MSYKLNPVKAVCNLGFSKRDIIGPSDKCFGICAAFSSGNDAFNIQPQCEKDCNDFIEQRRYEVYGVGKCDHQAPARPVIWDNIPRFVPNLMKQGKTPEEALSIGIKMCKNVKNLYNECVDLCNLDYSAIEKISPTKSADSPPEQVDNPQPDKLIFLIVLIILFIAALFFVSKFIFSKLK